MAGFHALGVPVGMFYMEVGDGVEKGCFPPRHGFYILSIGAKYQGMMMLHFSGTWTFSLNNDARYMNRSIDFNPPDVVVPQDPSCGWQPMKSNPNMCTIHPAIPSTHPPLS
jgi:hypothetical protein